MNTSKQINIMVLLVFAAVIATAAYTLWDPHRETQATDTQLEKDVNRGAYLFSQNCRTCHGDRGEGGAASNRLKLAPPLNRPDLQGINPDTKQVDPQAKALIFKTIVNTITCGRVGKSMPTWGLSQGGTLSDEQVRQLATMITEGTGWDFAQELARHGDETYHITGDDSDGMKLAQPLDATSTVVFLNLVTPLGKGSRIEIDNELMTVTDVNPDNNSVTVDRHIGTTKAAAHTEGTTVYKPPVPPDPAPITQPACGQTLPAAVPTAGPATPSATLTITAQGIAFDKDKLLAVAGQPLTLTFDNKDAGTPHNIHFFKGTDATGESVAQTPIETGAVTQTLNFGPLDAGDYYYQCDVHPQMFGTLTAQ